MASYRDIWPKLLSWHYFEKGGIFGAEQGEGRGEDFLNVLGDKFDELLEWWKAATTASFVRFAPDEALPYLAQNYNLEQPEAFQPTPDKTRTMVDEAWDTWERSGSNEGIIREVQRLGYPKVSLLPVWQFKRSLMPGLDEIRIQPTLPRDEDHNPLFLPKSRLATRIVAPFGPDPEWGEGWWNELNFHHSSFWVVINTPHPFGFRRWGDPWRFGDGGFWDALVTGNRVDLRRLYLTIRKHRNAHFSPRGVLFTYPGHYQPVPNVTIWSTWAHSSYNVWAVGNGGLILHWDGANWSSIQSPTFEDLFSVWGRAADDVWAVGRNGTIIHFDGTAWTMNAVIIGNPQLNGCVGAGDSVWAVGLNGVIVRKQGAGNWQFQLSPVVAHLVEMFATGPNDVWAVGAGGTIIRWAGVVWFGVPSGTANGLYGIWGRNMNDIWATGDNGTITHWNGAVWGVVASPTAKRIASVWGTPDGKALACTSAVAGSADLLHFDLVSWKLAPPPMPNADLWGVHGTVGRNFWVVGDAGHIYWGQVDGRLYWSGTWGNFNWGDGTRYNLHYALKRLSERWE